MQRQLDREREADTYDFKASERRRDEQGEASSRRRAFRWTCIGTDGQINTRQKDIETGMQIQRQT